MKVLQKAEVYDFLLILKNSSNAIQRRNVVYELLDSNLISLVDSLCDIMSSESDVEILAYIAEVIIKSNHKDRVEKILPLIQHSNPILRTHICGLLGNCADEIALEHLIKRLRLDEDVNVRLVAAWSLGKIGSKMAIEALSFAKENDFVSNKEGVTVSEEAAFAIKAIERFTNKNG